MLKTAECVSPKHPDKICDRISDAILDACLEQDENSRVAIETMGGHGIVTITGELTTNAFVDMREIAQRIAGEQYGVQVNVVKQSNEIANGVDTGGAGDQGIMVGYATNETKEMIPLEALLSRDLCKFLYKKYPYDGKTQITIDSENYIVSIVASFQNTKQEELRDSISEWIKDQKKIRCNENDIHANPAGDWTHGGFEADTGLTGRKLAVDNYGPQIPIGGGCFSGKDASKVDRTGAYGARHLAVTILKEMNAKEVFVKVAYAIGVAEPVMISATINGVERDITMLQKGFTPEKLVNAHKLKEPKFEKTAEWGHFGNGFDWEK